MGSWSRMMRSATFGLDYRTRTAIAAAQEYVCGPRTQCKYDRNDQVGRASLMRNREAEGRDPGRDRRDDYGDEGRASAADNEQAGAIGTRFPQSDQRPHFEHERAHVEEHVK